MADVEQLEAMGSVDVPVAVAADNRQGNYNENENRNGVNDVEDATVINDKDDRDDDIDDDGDNNVAGSSTAQIVNWLLS